MKDADGNVIGKVLSFDGYGTFVILLNDNSTVVHVNATSGATTYGSTDFEYSTPDCSGTPYVFGAPVLQGSQFAWDAHTAAGDPLYTLGAPANLMVDSTWSSFNNQCLQYSSPFSTTGYTVQQVGVIPPGFNGPLTLASAS